MIRPVQCDFTAKMSALSKLFITNNTTGIDHNDAVEIIIDTLNEETNWDH